MPLIDTMCIYGSSSLINDSCNSLYLFNNKHEIDIVKYMLGDVDSHIKPFYSETLIKNCIKKGVNDFTSVISKVFSNHIVDMDHDYTTLAYPFEYLLNISKYEDINIFDYSSIYYKSVNGYCEKSLFKHWMEANPMDTWLERGGESIAYYPFLYNKSDFKKAMFLMVFDQETLNKKLKIRFGSNKRVYNIIQTLTKYIFRKND